MFLFRNLWWNFCFCSFSRSRMGLNLKLNGSVFISKVSSTHFSKWNFRILNMYILSPSKLSHSYSASVSLDSMSSSSVTSECVNCNRTNEILKQYNRRVPQAEFWWRVWQFHFPDKYCSIKCSVLHSSNKNVRVIVHWQVICCFRCVYFLRKNTAA